MVQGLGGFEQHLLLVILRLGRDAYGGDIARELEAHTGRRASRGALYTTLDRLEDKGLIRWTLAAGTAVRDGLARRRYVVTASGLAMLRASRRVLQGLWSGLEDRLKDPS